MVFQSIRANQIGVGHSESTPVETDPLGWMVDPNRVSLDNV